MRYPIAHLPISRLSVALAATSLAVIGSCTADFGRFVPGTYVGDIPCTLEVVSPTGTPGQETFTENITVTIGSSDAVKINGVPVEIGAMHVRTLPNADLAFEVIEVQQSAAGNLQITYAPRPSLPGIEMSGTLVESYRQDHEGLKANATAELELSSIDGITSFSVVCNGNLSRNATNP